MPNYAKFLKNVMSKKRSLEDYETMMLTEESSAIIQRKLPQKLKDPAVPYTMKLGVGEVKATSITLQLGDRSLAYPNGVVDDVLVKVDKFIFHATFRPLC
ncbi:hypothetical protein OROGR_021739 [Orobanche gracilis]